MRQFDILDNPSIRSRAVAPYVVVLQSHHLAAIPTTIIAPLFTGDRKSAYSEINVIVEHGGQELILSVSEMVAVDIRELSSPNGNLIIYEDEIRRAMDRLFTGF